MPYTRHERVCIAYLCVYNIQWNMFIAQYTTIKYKIFKQKINNLLGILVVMDSYIHFLHRIHIHFIFHFILFPFLIFISNFSNIKSCLQLFSKFCFHENVWNSIFTSPCGWLRNMLRMKSYFSKRKLKAIKWNDMLQNVWSIKFSKTVICIPFKWKFYMKWNGIHYPFDT